MKHMAYRWQHILFCMSFIFLFFANNDTWAPENQQRTFFCDHCIEHHYAQRNGLCIVCAYAGREHEWSFLSDIPVDTESMGRDRYGIHYSSGFTPSDTYGTYNGSAFLLSKESMQGGSGVILSKDSTHDGSGVMLSNKEGIQNSGDTLSDKEIIDDLVVYSPYVFDGRPFGCDQTVVKEIDSFETPHNTHISVLQDDNGKKFVVKQETRDVLTWHLSAARDKLGALVARSIYVLANRVEIIPSYATFPGKRSLQHPATLHEFVPGIQIAFLPERLARFQKSIQQFKKPSMPEDKWGLTEIVIGNMSCHEDLPRMVALDTFLANADRNDKNYFYDEESNHFFAIDFESSFQKNIACYACGCIQSIIKAKEPINSIRIMRGLKRYRNVLNELIRLYTPDDLHEKLVQFALEGGILSRALKTDVEKKLERYGQAIRDNYDSCKQLVILLDQLILKYG